MTVADEQPRTRVLLSPEQPPPNSHRRRPAIRTLTSAGLVGLLIVGGYAVGHRSTSDAPTWRPSAAPTSPTTDSPAVEARQAFRAGVPVGYANTASGAQSAATNYTVAYGSAAMFDPSRRHAIVAAIADPVTEQSLQTQLDASFAAVMASFGLDSSGHPPTGLTFVDRTLPVGVHLLRLAGGAAQVEVWTAGLIGLAGAKSTKPVAEAWSTATISLRWTGGDWKWVSFTQHDGPTPVSGLQAPSGADRIAQAVRDFAGLRYAR
ncbi:MAG: hypothetical protein ACR2JO_09965 [Mycobacteriales bacterium]